MMGIVGSRWRKVSIQSIQFTPIYCCEVECTGIADCHHVVYNDIAIAAETLNAARL